MAHNVSNEYKQVIYSGDARNKLKLLFNNVELQDADRYCEKLTIKSRIIPNGAKIFNLNNFISKEADLILHDIDTSIIQDQVSISIGTLVGNSYEYVPIGIFNIQDTPTNDKNKTTIKLRDNSVKFDFNYNAQPLIEENGGSATKLQILQDICSQAGVTCNITSFIGYLDNIGVYDNTITAREYISRIAEQAGRIATINRSGELIFIDLNSLTTWEIPIEVVEKYENGTKFKIGRVVYEDGIVRYETPTSNDDTLFLDGSNNYINGELVKEQANSSNNSYTLQNTGEADLAYFEMEGKTTQATRSGKNLLPNDATGQTINGITSVVNSDGSITFNGTASAFTRFYIINYNASIPISAGTYTLSVEKSGTTSAGDIYMNITFNSLGLQYFYVPNVTYKNIVLSSNDYITSASITFAQNVSLTNFTIKPQLEAGSTQTAYEQYGLMPSPDFPSELVSVGYENLFNIPNGTKTSSDLTATIQDGIVSVSGTATATSFLMLVQNTFSLKAGTYTISAFNEDTYNDNQFDLRITGKNGSGIKGRTYLNIANSSTTFTLSEDLEEGCIQIRASSGDTLTNFIVKPQLTKGTQTHSYISYGKYGIEAETNSKNLFDNNKIQIGKAWNNDSNTARAIIIIPVKPSTSYTISFNSISGLDAVYAFGREYEGDNTRTMGNYDITGTRIITTTANTNYLGLQFNKTSITKANIESCLFQVEEGSQATNYETGKSNTYLYTLDNPLRSIGTTKDLLYIKNGMLYVERKIGYKKITSNMVIAFQNVLTNSKEARVSLTSLENITDIYSLNNIMSNSFKGQATWNNDIVGIMAFAGNPISQVAFRIPANATASFFDSNDVYLQYVLATPYIEELGQVEMLGTYEGITYIDIASNINANTYLQYRESKTQVEAILKNTNQFSIDSLKTGKILGNPAIDSYDLIQIHDKSRNLLDINTLVMGDYRGDALTIRASTRQEIYLESGEYTLSTNLDLNTYGIAVAILPNKPPSTTYNAIQDFGYVSNQKTTFNVTSDGYVVFTFRKNGNLTFTIDEIKQFAYQFEKGRISTDYVTFKDETYTTLATNDLVYTGVLINTFDTQIGEEAKEQNVFINGEETFKKWARTKIDNVEGSISLQAGQINETNGRINETNLTIDSQGALLNVIANNSNIDIEYDGDTPISGEIREVTTTTGFTFNAEGMTISDSSSNFYALHRNTGTYYYDGAIDPTKIVGQYTKDGSKQKDLVLFGVYYYGMEQITDTPMFVTQLYNDENGEECVGHFYNRGD